MAASREVPGKFAGQLGDYRLEPLGVERPRRFGEAAQREAFDVQRLGDILQRDGLPEDVLSAKNTVSPTLIWLKELPGDGKPRSTVLGTLQQDTYIRIYVPIKPLLR